MGANFGGKHQFMSKSFKVDTQNLRKLLYFTKLYSIPQLFAFFTTVHIITFKFISGEEGSKTILQGYYWTPKPALHVLHEESYPPLWSVGFATRPCFDYSWVTGGVQLSQVFLARNRQGQILKGLEGYRHPITRQTLY